MDDRSSQLEPTAESIDAARVEVADERLHAEQFLAEYQQRLDRNEGELVDQILALVEHLTNREAEFDSREASLNDRVELLQSAADQFEQEQADFEARKVEASQRRENESQQEFERRESLECRESELKDREAQLAGSEQQLEAKQAELAHAIDQQVQQEGELESRGAELDERAASLSETEQRLEAAQAELSTAAEQHAQEESDVEARAAALAEREQQLNAQRDEFDAQRDEFDSQRGELDSQRDELDSQRDELDKQRQQVDAQQAQVAADREAIAHSDRQLAEDLEKTREAYAELEARLADGERERELLAQQCDELSTTLDQRGAELEARDEQIAMLDSERASLEANCEQLTSEVQTLTEDARSLEENNASLTETIAVLNGQIEELISKDEAGIAERDELREQLNETQVAADTKAAQINELDSNIETLRREQEDREQNAARAATESAQTIEQLREEIAELKQQLTEDRKEHDRLAEQNVALETSAADAQQRADQLDSEAGRLRDELEAKNAEPHVDPAEAKEWQAERVTLIDKLADAELQVSELSQIKKKVEKQEELERRFEMAVEDARKLKTRVAELEEQLSNGSSNSPAPVTTQVGANLDWEAMKSQMMASFADDFDETDEQQHEEKLTIEGTIRITDEVVADKEREIAELRKTLESQSEAVGDVAVGAAAIAEMVDKDEIIQQEREQLVQLKEQWREKLRQAEIEISVERAKMARQRAEIEDRQQTLDSSEVRHEANGANRSPETKSSGGRWLARLGLKDLDE